MELFLGDVGITEIFPCEIMSLSIWIYFLQMDTHNYPLIFKPKLVLFVDQKKAGIIYLFIFIYFWSLQRLRRENIVQTYNFRNMNSRCSSIVSILLDFIYKINLHYTEER